MLHLEDHHTWSEIAPNPSNARVSLAVLQLAGVIIFYGIHVFTQGRLPVCGGLRVHLATAGIKDKLYSGFKALRRRRRSLPVPCQSAVSVHSPVNWRINERHQTGIPNVRPFMHNIQSGKRRTFPATHSPSIISYQLLQCDRGTKERFPTVSPVLWMINTSVHSKDDWMYFSVDLLQTSVCCYTKTRWYTALFSNTEAWHEGINVRTIECETSSLRGQGKHGIQCFKANYVICTLH